MWVEIGIGAWLIWVLSNAAFSLYFSALKADLKLQIHKTVEVSIFLTCESLFLNVSHKILEGFYSGT